MPYPTASSSSSLPNTAPCSPPYPLNLLPTSSPLCIYGDDGGDDGECKAPGEDAGFINLPNEIGLETRGGVGLDVEGIGIEDGT
jgi:hypothetical protein